MSHKHCSWSLVFVCHYVYSQNKGRTPAKIRRKIECTSLSHHRCDHGPDDWTLGGCCFFRVVDEGTNLVPG